MTEYNGQTITYDRIGNPLTYRDGMTMTWKRGRQLTTLQTAKNSIQYKYDSDSIRTSKIVDGVVHTYEYLNGLLMHETRGEQAYDYYYDANGQLYAVSYKLSENDTKKVYYFTHNWRGDIVGIYNGNGDLKATYSYDAWGNVLSIEDADGNAITSATHIANLNPFRYRGYYMDTETGLYYLMSRYYDPVTHRFLNADSVIAGVGATQGYNLYTYCFNNPVNKFDQSGNWPRWITAAVAVTAAVVAVAALVTGNFAVAAAAAKVSIVASVAYVAQTLHFDARANLNKGMDEMTYDEAKNIKGANTNVSDTFHDFSGNNNKVCLPDEREGVYDSFGNYVDDPRDVGTYNVFVPTDFCSTCGHVVIDVFPYLLFGNNDDDPGFIINFPEKWTKEFITLFE